MAGSTLNSNLEAKYLALKTVFAGQPMPFAYLDLAMLDENIRQITRRAADKPVRIATKSVRSLWVLKYLLASLLPTNGLMCYSPREAVALSQSGLDNFLLGYPSWQEAAIRQVCHEIKNGKTIILMVDSVEHARHLAPIAASEGVTLPLCLDVDMSLDLPGLHFGVWRSGVMTPAQALEVYREIERHASLKLMGVMGYEAQIAGIGDKMPGKTVKNRLIAELKKRSIAEIAQRRSTIVAALQQRGAEITLVNGGGTGSLESTTLEEVVTEVTVGSGFFAPTLFDSYSAFKHLPAAGFALEVVRQPKPGLYTCAGGGYVASGAAGVEKLPTPYLPAGATLLPLEGAGEVQTPVKYTGNKLVLGDPVFMRHSKAGELCEHFNSLLLMRGNKIVDEVPTYRGLGWSFL